MSAELFHRPEIHYYRFDGTVVTSRYFANAAARYRIRDLTGFAQSQRPAESRTRVGLLTAAVECVILMPVLVILRPALGIPLVAAAMLVPVGAGYLHGRRRPPVLELIAYHRGQPVMLFASTNRQQFGQVARAVVRAIEAQE
jgi:hypothetical protein